MTAANSVSTRLMMRMLRAVTASMLRNLLALLKAPAARGISRVARIRAGSLPRSSVAARRSTKAS